MQKLLKDFVANESGATAIEYGLIAAGMAVVVITAINKFGSGLSDTFENIGTKLSADAAKIK